jgi:acyl-CoA synthetase (AMP-forming)/AMP-acid ligase II
VTTTVAAVGGANLADLLEQVAEERPTRPAIRVGGSDVTYCDFVDRVHRLANVFAAEGIGAGDHVGVALRNTVDHLATLFAAFTVRAVPVNVNLRYTAAELRALFTSTDLRAVIHEPEPDLTRAVGAAIGLTADRGVQRDIHRLSAGSELDAAIAGASSARPDHPRSGDDHYLLCTGGTTGTPKAVLWRHEDLYLSALQGSHAADGARVRLFPASPLTHGTAQWTALITLLSGGTVVLGHTTGFDPEAVWTCVERCSVTHLVIVGDAFGRPLAQALDAAPRRWELGDLLVVVSGGATLSGPVRAALLDHLPGAAVVDGYGTTETGSGGQMAVFPGQAASGLRRFVASPGTAVLDDGLRPVVPGSGAVGRLARRGRVPLGYYGDDERTARTFITIDGERWALTGDLASVDTDGTVVLLGRSERIINTGGEKIFAEEVEAVLVDHEAVIDAVVVGVPDERWGERVTAVVALDPHDLVDPSVLITHCRQHLAGFKTPRRIEVVPAIPRLSNGKPDHRWARMVAGRSARDGATERATHPVP